MKRSFDLLVAGLGLVILSPLFLIVTLAVRITNGSPVIFRQLRVGRNGSGFSIYKFRTMSPIAGHASITFEPGSKARVTAVGRWLRRTKLDELPQLWNVVKGDMSIVGPRPEVREWVEVYPERWEFVHSVRPGITDNASVLFRNEEEILAHSENPERLYRDEILIKKLALYESYVRNQSFLGDIKIIIATIVALPTKKSS